MSGAGRLRLETTERRAVVVQAAVRIAESEGLASVTHGNVAGRCAVRTSVPTIRNYFPHKIDLWRAVLDATTDEDVHMQAATLGVVR